MILRKNGLCAVILTSLVISIIYFLSVGKKTDYPNFRELQGPITTDVKYEEVSFFKPDILQPSNESLSVSPNSREPLSEDVTIVTAFINIGKFQKGEGATFTPDLYHKWMKVFAQIRNPVIFYLETSQDIILIQNLRKDLDQNLTKIVRLNRTAMWSFSVRDKIAEIYSQPSYPKHHPNTVVPEYSCAMHAKYEVMYTTVMNNPFQTKYFAWLDIGLFRELQSKEPFKMSLPPNFNPLKVAYTQVYQPFDRSATKIFLENHVWVCGCFFIAEGNTMLAWVKEYMQAVEHFIHHNIMSTDQQIIYSMFMDDNFDLRKPQTKIQ
ncbi:hypothetical protein CAPTEDRAFT_211318, partial [Capitella teleta]